MIKAGLSSLSKSKSLTAKIRNAEQQIAIRQRGVDVNAASLIKKIHQQMTAPSTLLLTVGIGFIIGELTKRQTSSGRGTADRQRHTGISPLRTALNLMISVHTLYTALPVAWIIKSFHQPSAPAQVSERKFHPSSVSGAASNQRKSF
jgi:hypothetical protein